MKLMIRMLLLSGLVLVNSACSSIGSLFGDEDNAIPPAELRPVNQTVALQALWNRSVSSGNGDEFVKLRPALTQNAVLVAGHDGDITAVSASSGQVLWQTDIDLPISAGVGVGDNLALVGTIDGDIIALNQTDGSERWRARVSSEVLAPPQAADGIVVVRTVDGNFTALNASDGSRVWGYSYSVPVLSLRGTSAPLIAKGAVLTGLDTGKILVLQLAGGVPVWEKTIAPARGRTELDRMVDIDAEPKLLNDQLYVVTYQGNVTAIDLNGGNTLWTRDFSSYSGLDVDSRQIYASDEEGSVWALDRNNGGSLWRQNELSGRRLSAPVASGDYVVVGDFEGYLHWLDKDSGRIVGRLRLDSDGISASPVARNNTLYVLGRGGELSAIQAGPPG